MALSSSRRRLVVVEDHPPHRWILHPPRRRRSSSNHHCRSHKITSLAMVRKKKQPPVSIEDDDKSTTGKNENRLGRMKIDNGINNLVPGRWSCLVSCTIFLLPIRVLAFGIRIMWSNNDSNDDRIELTEMMMYALRGYDETKRHDTTQHDANH